MDLITTTLKYFCPATDTCMNESSLLSNCKFFFVLPLEEAQLSAERISFQFNNNVLFSQDKKSPKHSVVSKISVAQNNIDPSSIK